METTDKNMAGEWGGVMKKNSLMELWVSKKIKQVGMREGVGKIFHSAPSGFQME